MRSRKALGVAVLLTVVVLGGGVVGLIGSSAPAAQPGMMSGVSRPLGANQGLPGALNSLVSGFGSASSPGPSGPNYGFGGASRGAVASTTTVMATAIMSSTSAGPSSPQTILLQ